ncbi:serine/threonine-protein kinase [Sorangium sp. So ce834]|uniref:serine/threonine protein kinase n=1 Tax=Sorangium sp. So ce834 TaxID=3133321 RepID=UPI003F632B8E
MVDGSGLGYRIVERLEDLGHVDVHAAVDREGRDALLYLSEAVPGGFRDGLERLRAVSRRIEEVPLVLDGGLGDSFCWAATERYDGRSLRALLEERPGSITPPWALSQVAEVAEVLKVAHAAGVFHGDLCPERVILLDDGSFKLTGLGLAQLFGLSAADAAEAPAYRAPEQLAEPAVLDERTDVHALGLVLYELIGLRRPFAERAPEELVRCILNTTPLPLETFVPLPPLVAAVVRRATERPPEARYRDMAELIAALHGALEGWCRWQGEVDQGAGPGVRRASMASRGGRSQRPASLSDGLARPSGEPGPRSGGATPHDRRPEPASEEVTERPGDVSSSISISTSTDTAPAPGAQVNSPPSPPGRRTRIALTVGAGGLVLAATAAALVVWLHLGSPPAARPPTVARLPRVLVLAARAAPGPGEQDAVPRKRPLRPRPALRASPEPTAPATAAAPVPAPPEPKEPVPPCNADWYECGASWPDARSSTFR